MYRVNEFSKEKKYITVCAVGMRAESAKKFFEKKRFSGFKWRQMVYPKRLKINN